MDEHRAKVQCLGCKKVFSVTSKGVSIGVAREIDEIANMAPISKLSKLQAAALQDIAESGFIEDLGAALIQAKLAAHDLLQVERGYPCHVGTEQAFARSKMFECPYCNMELSLLLDLVIVSVLPVNRNKEEVLKSQRPNGFGINIIQFVNSCREAGLIDAFAQAVEKELEFEKLKGTKCGPPYGSIEKYFLNFLNKVRRCYPKNIFFREISEQFENASVQYWKADGVAVITCDDQIYRFVPAHIFQIKEKYEPKAGLSKLLMKGTSDNFESEEAVWIRSRFGYIPLGSQIFLQELRQKSLGAFANPSQ